MLYKFIIYTVFLPNSSYRFLIKWVPTINSSSRKYFSIVLILVTFAIAKTKLKRLSELTNLKYDENYGKLSINNHLLNRFFKYFITSYKPDAKLM